MHAQPEENSHDLSQIKVMVGEWAGYRRLRVDDWRIIYWVDENNQTVYVDYIGSRGDIYKKSSYILFLKVRTIMNIVLRIAFLISSLGIMSALIFAIHYQQWFQLPFLANITTGQSFILMLVSLEITILAFGAAAVIYLWQKFFPQKSD